MIDDFLVSNHNTVKNVITHMEKNNVKAVIVVGENNELIGLFSLGDMRHFFLRGGSLNSNIMEAMNPNPIVFHSLEEVRERKQKKPLILYPIVDEDMHVTDVITERMAEGQEKISDALKDIPLVVMAGGKGTRLYPYTKILPKALIPIGDYTIMERIIHSFEQYGCHDIYTVINYKGNMIKAYFNELDKCYDMTFVEEKEFLGTGGGLSLLKGKIKSPFFLSNCDILVNADFDCIYKTHKMNENKITIVCAMKDIQIPYGIIETSEQGEILEIKEKPEFSFLTNTGLYLIEPDVIDKVKEGEFIHLPDIAKRCMENGEKVGVFPVSEKAWMDMGQFSEMETMMKSLGIKN